MNTRMPDLAVSRGTQPSDALENQDVALYVNGKRVNSRARVDIQANGIGIVVTFQTSKSAIDDPSVDPDIEIAWGGWKAGDTAHLYQPTPKPMPENGFVVIEGIRPARTTKDETMFEVKALTSIFDWIDQTTVCNASERALIPASWFKR